jgi:hypothetical protein
MLRNGGTFDGHTYLSRDAVKQMTTKQTGPLCTTLYGFGLSCSADGLTFGHGGAYSTNMTVDHGQIRIFLSQQAKGWAKGDPVADFDAAAKQIFAPSLPR